MSEISAAIGFNLIVVSPTIALVVTALVLLFFTITIESNEIVKQSITFHHTPKDVYNIEDTHKLQM